MDFNPSIPGYVFDHSEMTFLSSKKTHFKKKTSSDEKPRFLLQKKDA